MMATIVELQEALVTVTTSTVSESLLTGEEVYLNEERAHVVLKRTARDTDASWYLDTGASNHMTGDDSAFAKLDKPVSGKVR